MNRKKEKRGRRGPCGPLSCEEAILHERRLSEETSAVHVIGTSLIERSVGGPRQIDNVPNVVMRKRDQPGKVLIQLESLILAQSERWRQA